MSVLCGWASIDERGKASGGAAGDQTGREVKTGPWYYFGQSVVIRPKDRAKGQKMASIMRKLCNNDNIGYDQSQRTTLWAEMSRVGWNPEKVTKKCEVDCSALIAVVCKAAGYNISPDVWTGNLRSALTKTKKYDVLTSDYYAKKSTGLRAGDIILNPATHVIMAIADGPVVKGQAGLNKMIGATLDLDGDRGAATKKCGVMALKTGLNKAFKCKLDVNGNYDNAVKGAVSAHPVKPGQNNEEVRAVQCLLYCAGYDPKGIDGNYGPGMRAAVGAFQSDKGLAVDYSVGPKTMLRLIS